MTAIEYGLIASVIAVAVAAALQPVRDALSAVFTSVQTALGST